MWLLLFNDLLGPELAQAWAWSANFRPPAVVVETRSPEANLEARRTVIPISAAIGGGFLFLNEL